MARHTRADDERLLLALQMREEGVKYADIAKVLGVEKNSVIGMLDRVYRAEARFDSLPGPSAPGGVETRRGSTITLPYVPIYGDGKGA